MIEPTDGMANAGWDALPVTVRESGEVDLDDMKVALAAVLTIVERDYVIERRCPHGSHPARCGPCRFDAVKWPLNCGGMHPHYCVSCSDGHAKGDGCINCRQTGYDQTPWPNCAGCAP